MIDANFFLGYGVPFKELCTVYPPKVKDILQDQNYPVYKKLLLNSQEDLEDEFTELKLSLEDMPTPFKYLFMISNSDPKMKGYIIKAFEFFIHEPITMLEEKEIIVIGDLASTLSKIKSVEQLRLLKEEDFFDFQQMLRRAVGQKEVEPYNPNENSKVKYFKAKARLRDRVKEKNSVGGLTFGSTLAAICCMDLNLNPLNIGELSQAAVSVLIRYYQEKSKYEIDIQSLLAGADSKKVKPQNWIRNIEDF